MADYIDALVFGFILSFSFGPIFFILLETSITRGIKQAVFMDFGVIVSDLIFFSLAYFGASKIATEENQPALFLLGGEGQEKREGNGERMIHKSCNK